MTLEFLFAYPHVYKPLISILWASFTPFSVWRVWEKFRRESLLEFFERKEGLASIFQVLPFHPSFSSEKTFINMETQNFYPLSLVFSTQSIFLQNFKTFLSSNSMRPIHPPLDCIHTFSSGSHEIHLAFDWNMFLHDPTWKTHLMKSCSNFQFLIEFSPFAHEIGSSCLSSLWVLTFVQL